MRLAALYSGGKDSTYALYVAQQMGWQVAYLVSILPRADSPMFHVPNVAWTPLGAQALGIPHVTAPSGEGEAAELEALGSLLARLDVEGVVAGAIASDYQWSRIHGVCHALGLRTFAPLWRKDQAMVVADLLAAGFRPIVVAVAAEGLDAQWLGRPLDAAALAELRGLHQRRGVNVAGEGGEYETFVVDGPNFDRRIALDRVEAEWRGAAGTLWIREAHLEPKEPGPPGHGAARI